MARVVVVVRNVNDFAEETLIYGPYETSGIARAMLTRYNAGWAGYGRELVASWVEETSEPIVWAKVDTDPTL
jgi:hypothetical protein